MGWGKATGDKGDQMRLEREARWCTRPPWKAGQVSTAQKHSQLCPKVGLHLPRRVPFILHAEVFFSNFPKVLQGPDLVNCDKEPTLDSRGVPANSALSPEPDTRQSLILRPRLSAPGSPFP